MKITRKTIIQADLDLPKFQIAKKDSNNLLIAYPYKSQLQYHVNIRNNTGQHRFSYNAPTKKALVDKLKELDYKKASLYTTA